MVAGATRATTISGEKAVTSSIHRRQTMNASHTGQQHSKRGEVIIATIGLVGILVTAFLSNWDKVFPRQDIVQATYSGYRPTGTFETELRYFFEVSGARESIASSQQQLTLNQKLNLLSEYPEDADEINKVFDAAAETAPRFEDVISELMPVYQKHYSLSEIQELNKFYSTEIMQGMVKKAPLISQDAAPIQVRLFNDYSKRLDERLNIELEQQ